MSEQKRVLVTGARDWPDRSAIREALDHVLLHEDGYPHMVVVHGGARGVDTFADEWARDNWDLGVRVERHPAEWDRFGKSAGLKRNQLMVDLGADLCLAFVTQNSRGTRHCAAQAEKAGIEVRRFRPVSGEGRDD